MENMEQQFNISLANMVETCGFLCAHLSMAKAYAMGTRGSISNLKQFSRQLQNVTNAGVTDLKRYRLSKAGSDNGK